MGNLISEEKMEAVKMRTLSSKSKKPHKGGCKVGDKKSNNGGCKIGKRKKAQISKPSKGGCKLVNRKSK